MELLSIINDFTILSIIAVAIFATFKAMEKYPAAPLGTEYLYYGFFVILINRAIFEHIAIDFTPLAFISIIIHFIGMGSIITGGIKFKVRYYHPMPLLIMISVIGVIISYLACFVIKDTAFVKGVYYYSFSFALMILAGCFLLRPKMEKTGGYFMAAISLFLLAAYYTLYTLEIGKQILATAPFEFMILTAFIIGLIMINGNVLWYQMEFLLTDIKKSKERLKVIIQASPFPIIISKLRDDSLILINNKAAETFGIDVKHPENFKLSDFFADTNNKKELTTALEKQSELENFEVALKKANSTEKFWMLASSKVIDFEQDIAVYSAFQDISDIKEKESKLFDQATRDPLTNCYNRRQFEELAKKEIQMTIRTNSKFTVVMVDADHFKNVNDTYGHATGDIVLKELANCCRDTLRETDIVARFGGEEFVLLLPETTADLAYPVCDRLREKISQLDIIGVNGETVKFTVSMGLAESSTGETISDIIEIADAALYIAKETGRNRLVIGEKGMNMANIDASTYNRKPPLTDANTETSSIDNNHIAEAKQMPDLSSLTMISETNEELDTSSEVPTSIVYNNDTDVDADADVDDIPLDEEEQFIKQKSIWDDD